jgi:16S rRNA processing protein RimM
MALIGAELAIKKSQLAPIDEDDYYWSDLTGLQVVNQKNETLGVVDHLVETGANDVLVVKDEKGTERLIPFVMDEIVLQVDLDNKLIQVDWDLDY